VYKTSHFLLQALSVLVTPLGGMTIMIGIRQVTTQLNKRNVRILLLYPPCVMKATLANIRASDVRKLPFLLGGTGDWSSGNPKDGPLWFGSGGHMRLDWPLQVNDSELDFTAPWRQVRWMRDSLSPMSLPAGAVTSEHKEAALKHIQDLHHFADRNLQGHILPHGIIPIHVSRLLLLLGWYAGMLKAFCLQFAEDQFAVVFNLSELHKAHVLHHRSSRAKMLNFSKKVGTRPRKLSKRGHGCFISHRPAYTGCSAEEGASQYRVFSRNAAGETHFWRPPANPPRGLPRLRTRQKDLNTGSNKPLEFYPNKRTRYNKQARRSNDPARSHHQRQVQRKTN